MTNEEEPPKTYVNLLGSPEPWELVAPGYAAELELVMDHFSLAALDFVELAPGARVVDVAAGPGTLSLRIAKRVREVVAVDFAESMLAELERAARARGLSNIRSLRADGQALPLADAEFDAGFSLFGLMFFPDRARGFAELFRVLAPGATAVVSSWAPIADSTLFELLFGALRAADPTFPEPRRDPTSLENPDVFRRELAAAGFVDVAVHAREKTFTVDDAASFWERITRSNAPLVALRSRLGEAEWARRAEMALAHLEERLRGGPLDGATTALYGVGKKP